MRALTLFAALSVAALSTPVLAQTASYRHHHHVVRQEQTWGDRSYESHYAAPAWSSSGYTDSTGHTYDGGGMIPGFAQGS